MRPRADGFSLAEMLVALTLFMLVISALAGIQQSAQQSGLRLLGNSIVSDQASLLSQTLLESIAPASYIETPIPQGQGNTLTLWYNMEPSNGTGPLNPMWPVEFLHLCLAQGNLMYMHWGSGYPMPNFVCGEDAAGVMKNLAGGIPGQIQVLPPPFGSIFLRTRDKNVLRVQFQLAMLPGGGRPPVYVLRQTQINILAPAQ